MTEATRTTDAVLELLPEGELLELVRSQRWFGAKASELTGLRVLDHAVVRRDEPTLVAALAEIRYGSGTHDVYQLIAGIRNDRKVPGPVIASGGGRTSYEAVADPAFAHEVLRLAARGTTLPSGDGTIEFRSLGELPQGARDVRPLGLEQSNSSVIVDDELIVKVYRRLEAGPNPELELLRFLTTHGFANVPELRGWWSYSGPLMTSTLGVLQQFVPGAEDGWSLALEELASDPEDPAFCSEEPSHESLALLSATVDEEIEELFVHLPDDESVAPIAGRGDDVRGLLRELTTLGPIGRKIRHHGDLHLGQVLWCSGDWLVIDFEGEPARTLHERRGKRSPLRDVAGMLRSFSYAVSLLDLDAESVEQRAREDFLAGYTSAVQGAGLLPSSETTERLIRLFELEKAVYELRYELNHRPDWVPIPVAAIQRLIEEPV
jgi:predicted trehalose synthase